MNHRPTIWYGAAALIALTLFLAGCVDNTTNGNTGNNDSNYNCPDQQGQVTCGYCSHDQAASDNPNAGACRYCPEGYSCTYTDICGSLTCQPLGGVAPNGGGGTVNGGGSTPTQKVYYASCSQCQVGQSLYSYRGYSYETCNGYYQVCVQAQCGKILDNCR